MSTMILGLVMFLGMHSASIFFPNARNSTVAKIGEPGWKIIYSIISLAGVVLLVQGYGDMRASPDAVLLWNPPVWTRHLASLLMLVSFISLVAAFVPGNAIKARVGHPMLIATKTWALAHLLANGRLGEVVLFGAILVWAVVDFIINRRRDRASGKTYPQGPMAKTAITVVVGIAAWVGFAMWAHLHLIGVSPFGHG